MYEFQRPLNQLGNMRGNTTIQMMQKQPPKVIFLKKDSCAIFISFKIVVVFNTTSTDFVFVSADVVLKSTTILKEMRIAQLSS